MLKKKKIISILLLAIFIFASSAPTYAATKSYFFNITNATVRSGLPYRTPIFTPTTDRLSYNIIDSGYDGTYRYAFLEEYVDGAWTFVKGYQMTSLSTVNVTSLLVNAGSQYRFSISTTDTRINKISISAYEMLE